MAGFFSANDNQSSMAKTTGSRDAASSAPPHALAPLVLAALGVVYGDIGTSPLYTLRQCFGNRDDFPVTPDNVLGILSLIAWSLIVVVFVKYVLVILRADNKGEGGILALLALVMRSLRARPALRQFALVAGLLGFSLFLGDSIITPAISVLSAVEGLELVTPMFTPYIVPLALGILIGLFVIQRRGSAVLGSLFGPITGIWFVVIGGLGAVQIVENPVVLAALDPRYAAAFVQSNGWSVMVSLAAVVLAVTGAEALYADMGHFGRRPIRVAWMSVVFPGLLLNYFGQGALILGDPTTVESPFFLLAPSWLLLPLVGLATAATVIASQAVITGAYSMVHQGMQLGFLPRLKVIYTSEAERGQIYVPKLNWWLMVSVGALVLGFGSSDGLASAYGIAVTGTMAIDTVLAAIAAIFIWRWHWLPVTALFGALLAVDLAFFSATAMKFLSGGWVPLAVALAMFVLMITWLRGRKILYRALAEDGMNIDTFLSTIAKRPIQRVPGTAVYMTRIGASVPHALLHNLKHNKILHDRVLLLSVRTDDVPEVERSRRAELTDLGGGFYRATLHYGFREQPDVPEALKEYAALGLPLVPEELSFFVGRVNLVDAERPKLARWRRWLFVFATKNALSAPDFYKLPPNRVVEMGAQMAI